ncbi:hypothetical protein V1525DRAFT_417473 [Lipomyces kononenkoae]|uniref:Uncharacterized protein n=1 Tax=Lipomyces kononenkoae TaxID=34357 RepID=A0ACC3T8A0_LIPKO
MVFLLAQPKGDVAHAVAASRQDGPGYLCRQVREEEDDAPAPKSIQNANEMIHAMHTQAVTPEANSTSKPKPKPQHQFDVEGGGDDHDAAAPQQPAAPSTKPKAKAKRQRPSSSPNYQHQCSCSYCCPNDPSTETSNRSSAGTSSSTIISEAEPRRNPRIKRKAHAECEDAIAAPDASAIVAPATSKRGKLTPPDQQLLDNECV